MDKSTNEFKTFCKLPNGSVQCTKTVVDHTCKLTTSHVENTYQIRQFVIVNFAVKKIVTQNFHAILTLRVQLHAYMQTILKCFHLMIS